MRDVCRVVPGTKADLLSRSTDDRLGVEKGRAQAELATLTDRLSLLHGRLHAENARSVLLVLQGLDASGKDGTIRRVFTGLNPQGCDVESFKVADADRGRARLPVAHPQRAAGARRHRHLQPLALRGRRRRAGRRRDRRPATQAALRAHQRVRAHAVRRGNRGREDLPARRQGRTARAGCRPGSTIPRSAGSSSRPISTTRAQWDEYMRLYDAAITATSTKWAPWYVVPADHKWVSGVAAASILVDVLEELDPKIPPARGRSRRHRHRVAVNRVAGASTRVGSPHADS